MKIVTGLNIFNSISFLLLLVGAMSYFGSGNITPINNFYYSPTMIERELVINQAIIEGKETYSFQSNFIPGIGKISSWQEYEDTVVNME